MINHEENLKYSNRKRYSYNENHKTRDENRKRIIKFAEKNGLKVYQTSVENQMVLETKYDDYVICNLVKNIKEIKSIMENHKNG